MGAYLMSEIRPTVCLIARCARNRNPYLDNPNSLHWEDGTPATLEDYARHMASTHRYLQDETTGAVEMHMFPEVIANVRWDQTAGTWTVSGPCVIPAPLP